MKMPEDKAMDAKRIVVQEFTNPLRIHFPIPATIDDPDEEQKNRNLKAFMRPYLDALGVYPKSVLEKAAAEFIRTRKINSFPLISECIEVCDRIRDRIAPAPRHKAERWPEWEQPAVTLGNKLMVSDIGRKACEEGWQVALWDFMREQGRVPTEAEATAIRSRSLANWVKTNEALKNPFTGRIMGTLHKTIEKRKKLLKKISHGELPVTTKMTDFDDAR
jgi:hypothetical protein